ncbi:MAG: trypsin-like peptidase domain-containing protein [Symploca sp. SIO2D2]|nr:trypsin-like peptidase domain-containing protein [Symploca sp. SIO2D2]
MKHNYRTAVLVLGTVLGCLGTNNLAASSPTVPRQTEKHAKKITVLLSKDHPLSSSKDKLFLGSGAIIGKTGNTYYILTAEHTIPNLLVEEYQVTTYDNKQHKVDKIIKAPGELDLAVLSFTSRKNYKVASIGDSNQVESGSAIYLSGWRELQESGEEQQYLVNAGTVANPPREPLKRTPFGVSLSYNNYTYKKMSGGALIDKDNCLIGTHIRARAFSAPSVGIPINTALTFLGFLNASSANGQSPIPTITVENCDNNRLDADANNFLINICNFYNGSPNQEQAFLWLDHNLGKNLTEEEVLEFNQKYYSPYTTVNSSSQTPRMADVCQSYRYKSRQDEALRFLQRTIETETMGNFIERWFTKSS